VGGVGRRHDEDVVLDGAQPGDGVVQDDTEPVGLAEIGAAAVPDAAGVDEGGAGRQLDGDGFGVGTGPLVGPAVAAGDDAGGPLVAVKSCRGHITLTTISAWGRGTG